MASVLRSYRSFQVFVLPLTLWRPVSLCLLRAASGQRVEEWVVMPVPLAVPVAGRPWPCVRQITHVCLTLYQTA